MITQKMIRTGIANGTIMFAPDPNANNSGTVCKIGEYWFYFGGHLAEQLDPSDFLEVTRMRDNITDIFNVLESFKTDSPTEYAYYEAVLNEQNATQVVQQIPGTTSEATNGNYMLITVIGRTIETEVFPNLESAQTAMRKELITEGKADANIQTGEDTGDYGMGEYSAYSDVGLNNDNYDWLIVAI